MRSVWKEACEVNRPEEVTVTAVISAMVEGVRLLGRKGTNEWELYDSISRIMDRKAFDMIVAELVEQKTFKRDGNRLTYCGPCMVEE